MADFTQSLETTPEGEHQPSRATNVFVLIAGIVLGWITASTPAWNIVVYFHELAHVASAEALGGDASHFIVEHNRGGYVPVTGLSSLRLWLTLAAGYVGTGAAAAAFLLAAVYARSGRVVLGALCVIAVASLWWAPSLSDGVNGAMAYSWGIALAMSAMCAALVVTSWTWLRRAALAALAGLFGADNVSSASSFLSGRIDGVPSDISSIADGTGLPFRLVALLIFSAATVPQLLAGWYVIRRAWRRRGSTSERLETSPFHPPV